MISSFIYQRSLSNQNSRLYNNQLATYTSRDKISFITEPKIISPHISLSSSSSSSSSSSRITTLDIDNTNEGRFLLCGSKDCTVSVYDLSLLGSDYYLNHSGDLNDDDNYKTRNIDIGSTTINQEEKHKQQNTFRPICISTKTNSNPSQSIHNINNDPNYLPSGHCCPVTQVQWYPIDSGIFLSSDCIGNILLWDSNSFTTASCMSLSKTGMNSTTHTNNTTSASSWNGSSSRWDTSSMSSFCSINSFDLPKNANYHMQLAVGCSQTNLSSTSSNSSALSLADDRAVYLCDIKSGSTTQQLIGHGMGHGRYGQRGVSTVKWSPVDEFILVSSGGDGCIKVWDVRKSGSTACLTTLDQEMKLNSERLLEYDQEKVIQNSLYNNNDNNFKKKKKRRKLLKEEIKFQLAPGNYSKVECSAHIQSHDGPVASFSFTPDGEYIVSASPADGIHLWQLSKSHDLGLLMPTCFIGQDSLKHPLHNRRRKAPMIITQPGSNKTGTLWLGTRNLLGYDIHGMGGRPERVLPGHIDTITAMTSQEKSMRLFTGGADGMILGWGLDGCDKPY